MKISTIAASLALGFLTVTGCSPSNSAVVSSNPQTPPAAAVPATVANVQGTWKFDLANSDVQGISDQGKAEMQTMRLNLMADGTFTTTGMAETDNGTWSLEGQAIKFQLSSPHGPPDLTVSDDGTKLTTDQDRLGLTSKMTFVRE
jgi:hypothetical protein